MFDDQALLTSEGSGRYTASVGDRWLSLNGAHGGIVASLIVDAVGEELRHEGVADDTVLRAATFAYVTGNQVGESAIDVDIVRRGRSMISSHATVTQSGTTTTVAQLHHSAPRAGLDYSDVEPLPPKPDDAERFLPARPPHLLNVETYLHPDTQPFGGGARSEWRAWCRPLHGDTFDASWLTMFGDYFPPTVFARLDQPALAVTVEYSIQIHDASPAWTLAPDTYLAATMHAFHSHDGFAVEDGVIQHPDGRLLATVRQTRLSG
ncbi:MAG: thioesterase family protein [Acidimicrobiales bacterium]